MDTVTLVFAGFIVSLVITLIKSKVKLNMAGSMLLVAVISLVGAGLYVALTAFGYWEAFIKILTIAGAIYAYIIKNFKELAEDEAVKNA